MSNFKTLKLITLGVIFSFSWLSTHQANAQQQNITLDDFYDQLSPYGEWINDDEYGYVWRPDVDDDFRPYYSNGHWAQTNYGNTWISDYDWGWAPFHYGRWHFNRRNGWVWLPDTEWGPAWVSWRSGGGYYGWAPLGPRISINLSFGPRYYVPNDYWCFVPQRHILSPRFRNYYVPYGRNVTIIRNTTIINNVYVNNNRTYIAGPRRSDIERATRSRVNVYNINDASRPGSTRISNNSVNIYRPTVNRTGNDRLNANTARPTRASGGTSVNRSSRSTEDSRSNNDVYNGDRRGNGNVSTSPSRPTRSSAPSSTADNERSETDRANDRLGRPDSRSTGNGRTIENSRPSRPSSGNGENSRPARSVERTESNAPQRSESVERSSAPSPERVERPTPQRTESSRPTRSSEERTAPQRSERVERSAPERVERSAPQRSESSGSSSRSSGSSSSSRARRGGN